MGGGVGRHYFCCVVACPPAVVGTTPAPRGHEYMYTDNCNRDSSIMMRLCEEAKPVKTYLPSKPEALGRARIDVAYHITPPNFASGFIHRPASGMVARVGVCFDSTAPPFPFPVPPASSMTPTARWICCCCRRRDLRRLEDRLWLRLHQLQEKENELHRQRTAILSRAVIPGGSHDAYHNLARFPRANAPTIEPAQIQHTAVFSNIPS